MSYTVYKHITPSGKVYIGITSQKPQTRWKNGKGYNTCLLFKRAIEKYGWENIQHEILSTELTKEEAEAKEIELITFYHSNNPKYGYNMENGGGSVGKHSEKTLKKMSANRKGQCMGANNPFYHKHHPKEWVKTHLCGEHNPMYGVKGKQHPRFGVKHTEEAIQKMKNAKKGKHNGASNPNAKRIICEETGEVFDYIKNACVKMNANVSSVSEVLHGKRKTAGGYHWRYAEKEAA